MSPERRAPAEGTGDGNRSLLPAGVVAVAVIVLDQAAKAWATATLAGGPPRTVVPSFFHLVYHRNTGGLFGLFAGDATFTRRVFFLAATTISLAVILYLLRHLGRQSRGYGIALGLVAGGAVGNLIDRLRYGEVVDFIDWHWRGHHWPTFNLADSAITAGVVLIFLLSLLPGRPVPPGTDAPRPL